MHYRGFVFVPEPTDESVARVMNQHKESYTESNGYTGHWDWYRVGGRYDGYLVSDDEMRSRKTDDGFNFSPDNERIERNSCLASSVPDDRRLVYFFVTDGKWISCKTFVNGDFVETPDFSSKLDAAIAAHPEQYVVVIDAHS